MAYSKCEYLCTGYDCTVSDTSIVSIVVADVRTVPMACMWIITGYVY